MDYEDQLHLTNIQLDIQLIVAERDNALFHRLE